MASEVTKIDGSLDFSGGVNSYVVTTVQSERNPNGLRRNQVAWMDNCTVRGGGITQRTGWIKKGAIKCDLGWYQGSFMYSPLSNEYPYLMTSIGGKLYRIDVDNPSASIDLTAGFPAFQNPTANEVSYFVQAEQFLVIQAGDYVTNPLFWNGTSLSRSTGITNTAVASGTPGVNGLPPAGPMDYFMGRIWYAQGRTYSAGDIFGGLSGSLPNNSDALLNVTENPLSFGGDGFGVPSGSGNIRCLTHSANLNASLGEGQLIIFTREQVFSLTVPTTRALWIGADTNNKPMQTVIQINNGAVNQRSVVTVNGDLFFQSFEPSIRSLMTAVRYFDQWGNTPISINEQRILAFNDRSLMQFSSGIYFSNRVLQAVLPYVTPVGIAHKAIVPLNFDVISTLDTKLPPVWEGMYEGVNVLELVRGDFGGRERAFAVVWSEEDREIQLWELSDSSKFETDDNRVAWYVEFPAFTWGNEFAMKKMISAELWLDKILGTVFFQMDYRPDGDPCWYTWHKWQLCTAKNSCEDVHNPIATPYCTNLRESFRQTIMLPKPQNVCEPVSRRPANVGYQMQCRLGIKGWCRIRGLLLHAEPVEQRLYNDLVCS
jgi:hypothetical protein